MIGPFDCEFIPVTHSVPHGFATAFLTPAGTILHTGDFKIDLTPVDGRRTDLALLGEIARRDGGVRLLLSDSTNAERPGFTPSESTVGVAMRDVVPRAPDATIHRRQLRVAPPSRAAGRGGRGRARSQDRVRRPFDDAERLDVAASWASSTSRPHASSTSRRAPRYAPGEVCIICTGSQGEPMSALVAHGRARAQVREDQRGRRRRDLRARDPGQRGERVARHRLAAPRRRRSGARPQLDRCTCPATRRRKS